MLDVSILTEVMIELVDRYLNEKELRLENSRELSKLREQLKNFTSNKEGGEKNE